MTLRSLTAALTLLVPSIAVANPADDGYCDHALGAAAATAAPLFAPEVYGSFGHIEQPSFAVTTPTDPSNLRAIGGVRYSVTNVFAGRAIKSRARADCRRHDAALALRGVTAAHAVAARLRVYDEAQAEADRMLVEIKGDLEAKRATAPEANATRLRVDQLRTAAARARSELAALPAAEGRPLASLLAAYRAADADVEASEGALRKVAAYDLNVRVGVDHFVDGPGAGTDYFAVVQLGVNLGALWVGRHNARAARGRDRYARSGHDPLAPQVSDAQLSAMIEAELKRTAQVTALVTDLGQQLDTLAKLSGEQTKRFRETIWFDWIEAKAELAYLQAYVEALQGTRSTHATSRD